MGSPRLPRCPGAGAARGEALRASLHPRWGDPWASLTGAPRLPRSPSARSTPPPPPPQAQNRPPPARASDRRAGRAAARPATFAGRGRARPPAQNLRRRVATRLAPGCRRRSAAGPAGRRVSPVDSPPCAGTRMRRCGASPSRPGPQLVAVLRRTKNGPAPPDSCPPPARNGGGACAAHGARRRGLLSATLG